MTVLIGIGILIGKNWSRNKSIPTEQKTATQTDFYGTMLAYNINDAVLEEKGMIDKLKNGWSEFRTSSENYQKLKNGLKEIIQERNQLLKKSGFSSNREIAGYFTWNVIEPEKGQFNWELTDLVVEGAKEVGVKLSAVVQPFASWDQKNTQANPKCQALDFVYYDYKAGPPDDWEEYKLFLTKMVDRYKDTVVYWEIGNEYDGGCGGYQDNPTGYLELLKTSYETIKKTDSQAKVLNAGALEIVRSEDSESVKNFWQKFFELGGNQYLDYFNFHYNYERGMSAAKTDSTTFIEHLDFFNSLMEKNGGKKPLWITEFGTYSGAPEEMNPKTQVPPPSNLDQDQPRNLPPRSQSNLRIAQQSGQPPTILDSSQSSSPTQSEEFQAAWYFRNSIVAFANSADRLFIDLVGKDDDRIGGSALFNLEGKERAFITTLKTITAKIGGFSKVEKIAEGQYKFNLVNQSTYALWQGSLPFEITNKATVTKMMGEGKTIEAKEIKFSSEEPIFVEIR